MDICAQVELEQLQLCIIARELISCELMGLQWTINFKYQILEIAVHDDK